MHHLHSGETHVWLVTALVLGAWLAAWIALHG